MEDKQEHIEEEIFAAWEVPEYNSHPRGSRWYTIAISIAIALLFFSIYTGNFLLPVIIIIVAFIFIMQHGQEPDKVTINLGNEGIVIGQKFYDYDEFKHFAIVYKPKLDNKNLYFEFTNALKTRISIPLEDMNPVEIRNHLLKFLDEDLDRTDIPLSESLSKILKL
jgi:hypothetical protein